MRNYFNGLIYFLEQEPESLEQQKKSLKKNMSSIPKENPNLKGSSGIRTDPNKTGEINPSQSAMDPSLGLLPEEEPLDFTEIGKVFVLKKVYVKLLSINNILKNYTDEKYVKLKNDVEEVIDMFHTVVSNIDKVKDELDNYIKLFQDFTLNAAKKLDKINNKED